MFTLPPWPPKDYILKDVKQNQQSSTEFTPIVLPRVTQTNFSKFLCPVEYSDTERVEPKIENVHRKIIEIWGEKARAWWVDRPGENAYFLYQLHKSCKFDDKADIYNSIFQHKEKVFNRSFSNEFDCIEYRRLKKLERKVEAERDQKCRYFTKIEQDKLLRKQEKESMKVVPCKFPPPFWWKRTPTAKLHKANAPDDSGVAEESCVPKNWQEIPNFFRRSSDPCVRKKELLHVGLPFQNEACNWYYKNYPPPNIKFIPKKFGA